MAIERIRRTIKGDGFEKLHDYLREEDFSFKKTFRFGFPEVPTCLAHHPVQGLLAIGNFRGMIKILGKPGIETTFWHPDEVSVKQLVFVTTKGQLLSLCDNNTIYLWSFEECVPEIVHKLTFQQTLHSKPSCIHLPTNNSWGYIGTEGGDVYVLNVDTMELSGYVIHWNKICGPNRDGRVVSVLEDPWDPDKLLIGLSRGLVVVWSLQKSECQRYKLEKELTALCWGDNGKSFYAAYEGGVLAVWNLKTTSKPDYMGKPTIDGLKQQKQPSNAPCKDIKKICLIKRKDGDPLIVIAGGEADTAGQGYYSTVSMYIGRSTARMIPLDMQFVELLVLSDTLSDSTPCTPESLVILCDKGLKAFDLTCKQNTPLSIPYPLDIHSSMVTCVQVVSNVSDEVTSTLMSLRSKNEVEERCSLKPLLMTGGKWSNQSSQRYSADIILTGHADGSIRLWNLVGGIFQEYSIIETNQYIRRVDVSPQKEAGNVESESTKSKEGKGDPDTSTDGEKRSSGVTSPTPQTSAQQVASPISPSIHVSGQQSSSPVSLPKGDVFGFSPPQSPQQSAMDPLSITKLWFGFEDACLVASNGAQSVMLFSLSTEETVEDIKVLNVVLKSESQDSSSPSPPISPSHSSDQVVPTLWEVVKNGRKLLPGFQMSFFCNTYFDSRLESGSLAINCVLYSSKVQVLIYGTNKGLVVADVLKGIVLATITSNELLQVMADPKRRRDSVPVAFNRKWQSVRQSINTREEPKSPKPNPTPNVILRRQTTPDIVSSFRTSSSNSLPDPCQDVCCVTCIKMAQMAVDKHVTTPYPVLWVTTNQGLVAGLQLVETCLREKASPPAVRQVDIIPSGLAYDMKSSVLNVFAISESGHQLPTPSNRWIHSEKTVAVSPTRGGMITKVDVNQKSDTRPISYIVCVSDTRLKGYEVQKIRSTCKLQIVDGVNDFLRSADFCWIKESPCCLCTSISNKAFIISIKGLHFVTEIDCRNSFDFCPPSNMCVSELGRIFFMANDQEMQLITLYKTDIERCAKSLPEMYIDVKSAAPKEPQSGGVFSSLFGQKSSHTDRKQLFGGSGRPPPVAKSEAGSYSQKTKKGEDSTDGMRGKLQKLTEGFDERGERLGEIEENAARMRDNASDFELLAAKLAKKHHKS